MNCTAEECGGLPDPCFGSVMGCGDLGTAIGLIVGWSILVSGIIYFAASSNTRTAPAYEVDE
jgi:hypothetical protein